MRGMMVEADETVLRVQRGTARQNSGSLRKTVGNSKICYMDGGEQSCLL